MINEENLLTITDPAGINTQTETSHQIGIYLLRSCTESDNFKVRADFSADLYFNFKRGEPFDEKDSVRPYIYTLNLDVKRDKTGRLITRKDGQLYQIHDYSLRLGRKIPGMDTTFRDYYDEQLRNVVVALENRHTFIFDGYFRDHKYDRPPGLMICTFLFAFIKKCFSFQDKTYHFGVNYHYIHFIFFIMVYTMFSIHYWHNFRITFGWIAVKC